MILDSHILLAFVFCLERIKEYEEQPFVNQERLKAKIQEFLGEYEKWVEQVFSFLIPCIIPN